MGLKLTGFVLLFVALAIVGVVFYRNNPRSSVPLVFSPTQVLSATWMRYKENYLDQSTRRTYDPSRDDQTTSEAESYTMLRAVWMGDKTTFDDSWKFTQSTLQHKNDALFSWLYGKRPDGTFGVLTSESGDTAASDADSDIALSLIFAYSRWQDPTYLSEAKKIVSSMWDQEVITINGTPYLTADNLEKSSASPTALINPSYLSPYSYRLFAKIDPDHPWNKLVDSSYAVLQKSIAAPLGNTAGALPPDWVAINKQTGTLAASQNTALSSNYGYDALRVPFRMALDYQWNHDPRAKTVLSRMTPLAASWEQKEMLDTVYSHSGTPVGAYESPAMYGGAIGYFMVTNPQLANEIYSSKLAYLYDPDLNSWKEQLSYYDDNWAWFGIGLYNDLLPNLASSVNLTAFAINR
jgi:endo-1,4-beta-D-glucanase Y